MRKHLYVAGVDLANYGVYISGGGTFKGAEKNYTFHDVPNKNGTLLGYQQRFADIDVTYDCFIYDNFDTNIANLRSYLYYLNGRVEIYDDYHPNEYRLGVYQGPFEPTVVKTLDAGSFKLTFRCQPQRWLVAENAPVTLTPSSSEQLIGTNPTSFDAKPLFRVFGYGSIRIRHDGTYYRINISDPSPQTYIDIDCETMNCYTGTSYNESSFVKFRDRYNTKPENPPVLAPGKNYFYVLTPSSTHITSVVIYPRYWRI